MNHKSHKVQETEKWVDEYIATHGFSPTYGEIQKQFNLKSSNSAWVRCKKFRRKMRGAQITNKGFVAGDSLLVINAEFIVPLDRFDQFSEILSCINRLLK